MPSYRTKTNPGDDKNGKPLLGWKITTGAEKALNGGTVPKAEALKKIGEIRSGVSAHNGVYTVNGIKSNHTTVGDKSVAVAWHYDSSSKPQFVIVEAFIEHTGKKNDYRVI